MYRYKECTYLPDGFKPDYFKGYTPFSLRKWSRERNTRHMLSPSYTHTTWKIFDLFETVHFNMMITYLKIICNTYQ